MTLLQDQWLAQRRESQRSRPPSEVGHEMLGLREWMNPEVLELAKNVATERDEQIKTFIDRVVGEACIEALYGEKILQGIKDRDQSVPEFMNILYDAALAVKDLLEKHPRMVSDVLVRHPGLSES